jgi:hypothetical protein
VDNANIYFMCGKSCPEEVYGTEAVIFLRPCHSYVDIKQGKLGFAGSHDG